MNAVGATAGNQLHKATKAYAAKLHVDGNKHGPTMLIDEAEQLCGLLGVGRVLRLHGLVVC